MKTHLKLALALPLTAALLTGCSMFSWGPTHKIDTIVLTNDSGHSLQDVTIRVEAFGGKFYCGNLLDQTQCSSYFREREYEANVVTVSWSLNGNTHKTAPFSIPAPDIDATKPLTATLTLLPDNNIKAELLPH